MLRPCDTILIHPCVSRDITHKNLKFGCVINHVVFGFYEYWRIQWQNWTSYDTDELVPKSVWYGAQRVIKMYILLVHVVAIFLNCRKHYIRGYVMTWAYHCVAAALTLHSRSHFCTNRRALFPHKCYPTRRALWWKPGHQYRHRRPSSWWSCTGAL